MRVSGLLFHWKLRLGAYSVCVCVCVCVCVSSWLCCPLRFQNSPQTCLWEDFLLCGNFSSCTTPSPGEVSVLNSFCLSFCLLYFVLPLFKENRLPFWVPGVLPQRLEVVLWKFLSMQMIFWWICGWKVVSESYSSAILGPSLVLINYVFIFL